MTTNLHSIVKAAVFFYEGVDFPARTSLATKTIRPLTSPPSHETASCTEALALPCRDVCHLLSFFIVPHLFLPSLCDGCRRAGAVLTHQLTVAFFQFSTEPGGVVPVSGQNYFITGRIDRGRATPSTGPPWWRDRYPRRRVG